MRHGILTQKDMETNKKVILALYEDGTAECNFKRFNFMELPALFAALTDYVRNAEGAEVAIFGLMWSNEVQRFQKELCNRAKKEIDDIELKRDKVKCVPIKMPEGIN